MTTDEKAAGGATIGRGAALAFTVLTGLTALALTASIHFIFYRVPKEATMGIVQKIFYFHVPAAYALYLGAGACFLGSAVFLYRGSLKWDALARAGADVAVIAGMMVLTTGPLWAAKAWGRYWTWDPRLTSSMLTVMVYVAYVVLRKFAGNGDAERKFAAALGVLGLATIPIIKFSVQKWGGQHPRVISGKGGGLQHPDMKIALTLGFLTFTLLAIALIWQRKRLYQSEDNIEDLELLAMREGLAGD